MDSLKSGEYHLAVIWQDMWRMLALGADSASHSWATAALTTVEDGLPKSRTVIVRMADKQKRVLICHSDIRAEKIAQIRNNPEVSWLFWDPERAVQLRLEGRATVHHQNATAKVAWEALHPTSRFHYSQPLEPGTVVDDPASAFLPSSPDPDAPKVTTDPWFDRFALIECKVLNADWLCLSREGHRRARFTVRGEELEMNWLVP